MAASPSILLLFLASLAVTALATSNGGLESSGFRFEAGAGLANEQHSENNEAHSERRFGFPYPGIIFRSGNNVNSEFEASAEHQSENNNDGHSERKFHWPSSVGITISRSNEQNPESGVGADNQIGPNGPIHEIHHHHNHSAHNDDTEDGERKFHWPSSVGITISRSNEQNPESGVGADYHLRPNGPNHEHHHHHNDSAHGNQIDDERKFRWPSSVGFTITRSNEQNSESEHEDNEAKFFGLIPSLVPCNHTEQAGRSCSDCTHTLLCFANDIGIQRNCSPLYCNQGRCAIEPSVECSSDT